MTAREHLRALLDACPDAAQPAVPRAWLVELLVQDAAPSRDVDSGRTNAPAPEPDRLLTVKEAADELGVSVAWVHRHWRTELRGAARKLGTRTLRFSAQAVAANIAAAAPARRPLRPAC